VGPRFTVTLAILVSSHVVSRYLPRYRGYRTTLLQSEYPNVLWYGDVIGHDIQMRADINYWSLV